MIGVIIICCVVVLGLAALRYWFKRRRAKAGYAKVDEAVGTLDVVTVGGSYQNTSGADSVIIGVSNDTAAKKGPVIPMDLPAGSNLLDAPSMRTTVDLIKAYIRSFTD